MKKEVKVVGAAIISGDKVLVAQSPYSDKAYKSLKWEFPGGKIEPGESEEEAITREIHEELGCRIAVDALLPEIEHHYTDFILHITICLCHFTGSSTPQCLEHNALLWLSPDQLPTLDWAAADAACYPLVSDYLNRIPL